MMKSRISTDMEAEGQLALFLDEYFYPWLKLKYHYSGFERISDRELQLQGVDVISHHGENVSCIDEKAQLYYLNNPLPTFAFEIQYIKNGEERTGWLINNELKTDTYLILWPYSKKSVFSVKKDDFISVEAITLKKSKLLSYLANLGVNKDFLTTAAEYIRRKNLTGKITQDDAGIDIPGIYLFSSSPSKYVEAPINLVIAKSHLIKICSGHFLISASDVKAI